MSLFRGENPKFGPLHEKVQKVLNVDMPETMTDDEIDDAKKYAKTRSEANAIDRLNRQYGSTMVGRLDGKFIRIMLFSNRVMYKPFFPEVKTVNEIIFMPFLMLSGSQVNPQNTLLYRYNTIRELPCLFGHKFTFTKGREDHVLWLGPKSGKDLRDYVDSRFR